MDWSRTFVARAVICGIGCAGLTVTTPSLADHATDIQLATDKQFAMMDANKDGRISATEHALGARQMFVGMDKNKDGNVTAREMDAAAPAANAKSGQVTLSAAEKIKVVDKNGDGILSAAEHAAGSVDMFAKMDTNRDQHLSAAELNAGHESMLKKHAH